MTATGMPALSQRWICALLLTLACVGCSWPIVKAPDTALKELPLSKSKQELRSGVKSYEEGAYKTATKQFQTALDLGLGARSDLAKAHKYLAFITCVSGREQSCRDEFRKAFAADATFDLEPAEAGHPTWGPVFRSVKAETAAKAKSK